MAPPGGAMPAATASGQITAHPAPSGMPNSFASCIAMGRHLVCVADAPSASAMDGMSCYAVRNGDGGMGFDARSLPYVIVKISPAHWRPYCAIVPQIPKDFPQPGSENMSARWA